MNIAQIRLLSDKILSMKDSITTEEATKTSFILPFLQILGYDVFNPNELIAESVSDVGSKKGEKVDYLILKNSEPIYIIECKKHCENLESHKNQLIRYYHTSKARIGILTNGIEYQFYADLDNPNIMDDKPFFTFNILNFTDYDLKILTYFTKYKYDLTTILAEAASLKYMFKIKNAVAQELNFPSKELTTLLIKKVYPNRVTQKVYNDFEEIIKIALEEYSLQPQHNIKNIINEEENEEEDSIITTESELLFLEEIRKMFPQYADKITYRDYKGHFSVILNNKRNLIIAKAKFNKAKKYIVLIDSEGNETTHIFKDDYSILYQNLELIKNKIESILN